MEVDAGIIDLSSSTLLTDLILSKISLIFLDLYRKIKFNINFLYFIILFSNLINGTVKYLQSKLI